MTEESEEEPDLFEAGLESPIANIYWLESNLRVLGFKKGDVARAEGGVTVTIWRWSGEMTESVYVYVTKIPFFFAGEWQSNEYDLAVSMLGGKRLHSSHLLSIIDQMREVIASSIHKPYEEKNPKILDELKVWQKEFKIKRGPDEP